MAALTDRQIAALELPTPEQRSRDVAEGRIDGLSLVIQHTGSKSWSLRYRYRGKQRRMHLGPYPAIGIKAAHKIAKEALVAVHAGRDPQGEKLEAKRRETTDVFKEVGRAFCDKHLAHNRTGIDQARVLGFRPNKVNPRHPRIEIRWEIIPNGIAARWANRHVGSIAKQDVVKALDETLTRARARGGDGIPASNRALATLSKFFSWCIDDRAIIEGPIPCHGIKKGTEVSRDRVLEDAELRSIWYGASCLQYPWGPLSKLLILLGGRRSEVAEMRRSEIHGDEWHLPASRAKNQQGLVVPLPALARVILSEIPQTETDFVFTTTQRTPVSGFSKMKEALDRSADLFGEVADWGLHDLRRTFSTKMAEARVPDHLVEMILNHRSRATSGVAGIYNRHAYLDERREALELWCKIVLRIAPMRPELRAVLAEQERASAETIENENGREDLVWRNAAVLKS